MTKMLTKQEIELIRYEMSCKFVRAYLGCKLIQFDNIHMDTLSSHMMQERNNLIQHLNASVIFCLTQQEFQAAMDLLSLQNMKVKEKDKWWNQFREIN